MLVAVVERDARVGWVDRMSVDRGAVAALFLDRVVAAGRVARVFVFLVVAFVLFPRTVAAFSRTRELVVAVLLLRVVRPVVAVGRSIELRVATRAGLASVREFLLILGRYIATDLEFTEALPGRRLSLTLYTLTLLRVTRARSRLAGPL